MLSPFGLASIPSNVNVTQARLGTAVGELDDFLAELQAERLPRVAGGASTKNPNPGSVRDPSAEKSLENALDLLMGGRDSIASGTVYYRAFDLSSAVRRDGGRADASVLFGH